MSKIAAIATAATAAVVVAAAGSTVGIVQAFFGTSSSPSTTATTDIPANYLALYRTGATNCPGLDWTILAAIGKIESDHGRSPLPGVHTGENSAGAGGPMQFLQPTWNSVIARHQIPPAAAAPTQAAGIAVNYAHAQPGLPHLWGGDGMHEGGFDCSGLTHAAYKTAGITIPRTAQTQHNAGPLLPSNTPLLPGDLVFFGTGPSKITHVGIAISPAHMINAPYTGEVIRDPSRGLYMSDVRILLLVHIVDGF